MRTMLYFSMLSFHLTSTLTAILFFSVHAKLEEKMMLTAGRDGGLKAIEVMGMLTIRIADEAFGRIKLAIQVIGDM